MADNSTVAPTPTPRVVTSTDYIYGFLMFSIGSVGLAFYIVVTIGMVKVAKEMKGFRIFISDAFANYGQILMFGIWPGLVTLFQRNLLPQTDAVVFVVAVANNGIWFAMCEHYTLVAASRLLAVGWPVVYRSTFTVNLPFIIAGLWVIAFVHAVWITSQDWWAIFFFSPAAFGLTTDDWELYQKDQATFWAFYNWGSQLIPLALYLCAVTIVFKQRSEVEPAMGEEAEQEARVEKRLLIPCLVNQTVYLFGAGVVFKLFAFGGKWDLQLSPGAAAVFWNCYATCNSVMNALLLFFLSSPVNEAVKGLFKKS